MSGVFLSYSRADHSLAARILRRLRGLGVEVWWDEDMPGVDWQEELQAKAAELSGVLVVWTPNSVSSRHVKDEARLARENDKLINVVAGVSQPPFPYDSVNALPLDGWTGREPHGGWSRTVQTVESLLVAARAAKPGEITGALARREGEIHRLGSVVAETRSVLQQAQGDEAGAVDAAARADADLGRADTQHRTVVSQGLGPLVVEGARQELDAARQAKTAADQAMHEAKAKLSDAARALASAGAELEAVIDEPDAPGVWPEPAPVSPAPMPSVEAAPPIAAAPVALQANPEIDAPPKAAARTPTASPAKAPFWRRWRVAIGAVAVALGIGVAAWLLIPNVTAQLGDDAITRKDYAAANHWLTISAQRGNRGSAWELGYMYLLGQGTPVNPGQAVYWLQRSATEGDEAAILSLAEAYDGGGPIPPNQAMARYWYQQAAARGDDEAKDWLARHPQ